MAQTYYYNTLTTLRNCLAQIQTAMDNMDLDGEQSISTWATQLTGLVNELNGQISADDADFSNIYDAIVAKGQNPDEEDRDTYAPAILAINGGGSASLDTLNVTPSTSQQTLTPTAPLDGWDEVVVAAVTSSIDANIQAGNIKNGVTILGVQGTLDTTPNLQNKTVTPSTSQQTIQADNNYDGLDTVTVEAVTAAIDANIQQGNIKSGVQILGVTGNYTGGGSNYQQKTVTPSASQQVVSADSGYDALSQVTVNGSANLVAGNIKKDVEIFGVTGSYEGEGLTINQHPTSLAYAGAQYTGNNSHSDILPFTCDWVTSVDLQNIDTSNGLKNVFYNNTTITNLDLRGWDFENAEVTSYQNMFYGCSNLVTIQGTLKLTKFGTSSGFFSGCTSLVNLPITNFGFSTTNSTATLDLSACSSLDADTMIQNMDTNNSGKTRIIKLHATVYANLAQATIDAAASKNITLQSA